MTSGDSLTLASKVWPAAVTASAGSRSYTEGHGTRGYTPVPVGSRGKARRQRFKSRIFGLGLKSVLKVGIIMDWTNIHQCIKPSIQQKCICQGREWMSVEFWPMKAAKTVGEWVRELSTTGWAEKVR